LGVLGGLPHFELRTAHFSKPTILRQEKIGEHFDQAETFFLKNYLTLQIKFVRLPPKCGPGLCELFFAEPVCYPLDGNEKKG